MVGSDLIGHSSTTTLRSNHTTEPGHHDRNLWGTSTYYIHKNTNIHPKFTPPLSAPTPPFYPNKQNSKNVSFDVKPSLECQG